MLIFKNVHLSFKEYAKVNMRHTIRAKPTALLVLLPLVAGIFSWLFVLFGPVPLLQALKAAPFQLALFSFILVVVPWSTWQGMKRNYASTKMLQEPVTYTLSQESIQTDSPYVQSSVAWANVTALYLLRPYAIIMTSNLTGYFLDLRCLEAPATEADFLSLARQQAIPIK
jgi:hypothetical protein